jgi:hypothetical protein
MKTCKVYIKKMLASIVNVTLVLGIFIVLFPLSTPTAKADTLWYDNWTIDSWESYEFKDDTLIFNGTLTIEGNLTLDNCILQMRYKSPDDPGGDDIWVKDTGTFTPQQLPNNHQLHEPRPLRIQNRRDGLD